jgi:hypothetical protein
LSASFCELLICDSLGGAGFFIGVSGGDSGFGLEGGDGAVVELVSRVAGGVLRRGDVSFLFSLGGEQIARGREAGLSRTYREVEYGEND